MFNPPPRGMARVHFAFFACRFFFFGPVACAPSLGISAVGFTLNASRMASFSFSGIWIVTPGRAI